MASAKREDCGLTASQSNSENELWPGAVGCHGDAWSKKLEKRLIDIVIRLKSLNTVRQARCSCS